MHRSAGSAAPSADPRARRFGEKPDVLAERVGRRWIERLALQLHFAARRRDEAGQHPQGGGLAGTVGPSKATISPERERERELTDGHTAPEGPRQLDARTMSTGMDSRLAHFGIVADGGEEQISQLQVSGLGEVQAVCADVTRHIDDKCSIGIDKDGAFAGGRCPDAIVERDDLRPGIPLAPGDQAAAASRGTRARPVRESPWPCDRWPPTLR